MCWSGRTGREQHALCVGGLRPRAMPRASNKLCVCAGARAGCCNNRCEHRGQGKLPATSARGPERLAYTSAVAGRRHTFPNALARSATAPLPRPCIGAKGPTELILVGACRPLAFGTLRISTRPERNMGANTPGSMLCVFRHTMRAAAASGQRATHKKTLAHARPQLRATCASQVVRSSAKPGMCGPQGGVAPDRT